jgi:hypothetical protein
MRVFVLKMEKLHASFVAALSLDNSLKSQITLTFRLNFGYCIILSLDMLPGNILSLDMLPGNILSLDMLPL